MKAVWIGCGFAAEPSPSSVVIALSCAFATVIWQDCTATVLQTLYAYPLAGGQTYFLRVLLILVAAILLLDGLHSVSQSTPLAPTAQRFARPAAAFTLAAVALAYPVLAYRAKLLYASLTPLGMPGAERVHAEREEAEDFQWLVPQLRQNCDTFVGLPGIP